MYGLLLMNLQAFIVKNYGAKKWKEIKEALKIDQVRHTFKTPTQNTDFVLLCNQQVVIFGVVGHFIRHCLFLSKVWQPFSKVGYPKKGHNP